MFDNQLNHINLKKLDLLTFFLFLCAILTKGSVFSLEKNLIPIVQSALLLNTFHKLSDLI